MLSPSCSESSTVTEWSAGYPHPQRNSSTLLAPAQQLLKFGPAVVMVDKPSARETKRLQTRERLKGAAIAEFKRSGMAESDVGAIVTAAGGPDHSPRIV